MRLEFTDGTGHLALDTRGAVDGATAASVDEIRAEFDRITREVRPRTYKVDEDGQNAEIIHRFDESAARIVMTPQTQGG